MRSSAINRPLAGFNRSAAGVGPDWSFWGGEGLGGLVYLDQANVAYNQKQQVTFSR
jgi:hypothetical protein